MGYKRELKGCWYKNSPRRRYVALTVNICAVILFFGLLGGTVANFKASLTEVKEVNTFPAQCFDQGYTDVFMVSILVQSLNPITNVADVTLSIQPPARFIDANGRNQQAFEMWYGEYVHRIAKDTPGYTFYYPAKVIATGDVLNYPFDDYTLELDVGIYPSSLSVNDTYDVSYSVTSTPVYGFNFAVSKWGGKTCDVENISIHASRTTTFKLYPIFQICAFWVVNVSIGVYISAVVIWGGRKMEAGHVGLFTALLFAFPGFRNTAPGSPPIGCYLDYASFYWSMILVVVSIFGVVLRYLLKPEAGAAPAKKEEPKKPVSPPATAVVMMDGGIFTDADVNPASSMRF